MSHDEGSDVTAIAVEGLSKCYRRYARPQDRLLQALFPRRQRFSEFWALRDSMFPAARRWA
jgi:lipopolysaccharide transport system ATP-binding protein